MAGNTIPNTPDYTASLGAQCTSAINANYTLYGRGEVAFFGEFQYDDFNTASQEAYSLADFSAGVDEGVSRGAGVKNAFDSRYFPVARYGQLAPSGFIAEN